MADRIRQTNRINFRGLNTRLVPDVLPPGKSPCAINVRAEGDSTVRTRPGFVSAFTTVANPITDIKSFATLSTDNKPRLLAVSVTGSACSVYLDDGQFKGFVSSTGAVFGNSMIPYRPRQSPQSWMYIGNGLGYRKFAAPDASNVVINHPVGIFELASPDAVPVPLTYNEFTQTHTSWTSSGT